jgi:hypothetical protein
MLHAGSPFWFYLVDSKALTLLSKILRLICDNGFIVFCYENWNGKQTGGGSIFMAYVSQLKNIHFKVNPELIVGCFTQLFSKGVEIRVYLPCKLEEMLCDQVGIASDYLEKRIQTVFLDGRPVDDVRQAVVSNGATIALSAAMPGLVGAVLRKGGFFSNLRDSITFQCDRDDQAACWGRVIVKLFNMTTREVGPRLLTHGILLNFDELQGIIKDWIEVFCRECETIRLDDRKISIDTMLAATDPNETIVLQVGKI